jgi:hypothetical protein
LPPTPALAVDGVFSYLASDGLGSATVALDASGNAQAVTLYAPYGTTRYASGIMPGSNGYIGQHADAATGLAQASKSGPNSPRRNAAQTTALALWTSRRA